MDVCNELEQRLAHQMVTRGLARVPGELAFAHKGQAVAVSIDKSVYTGHFVNVHDRGRIVRQFRATHGNYEWNSIAAIIVEIAESRLRQRHAWTSPEGVRENNRRIADELATITGAGPSSRLQIEPSAAIPGRVRVKLQEIELDPVSVMQLYAVVSHALPAKKPAPRGKQ